MSSEIVWAILGVSVSVIFGVIGIYLTVKSRYPGRITFVNEQTIELFDAIGSSLDDLEVSYGGQQVSENLVLLNGAFINSGKTDISISMVEQPITLKLPDGYKWLTGKVVGSNIDAEFHLHDEHTIFISTGLFRCGEYVRFHALAQLPESKGDESNSKKLKKAINFEHRIANTRKIIETTVQPVSASKKELKRRGIPFLIMTLIMLPMLIFIIYSGSPKTVVYPYLIENGTVENVKVRTTREDTIKVISIDSEFEVEEEFTLFVSKITGSPSLSSKGGSIFIFILFAIQGLILVIALAMLAYDFNKNRKLLRIIDEQ